MPASGAFTLTKEERLCSKKLIDELFSGTAGKSMSAFPLRVVYMLKDCESGHEKTSILVSVPKRCFKRAVKRNKVKRQIREAFRKNKHIINNHIAGTCKSMAVAFIWLDSNLYDYQEVENRIIKLLSRLTERI